MSDKKEISIPQFKIPHERLMRHLRLINDIVDKKTVIAALSCVLISADKKSGNVKFLGTNLQKTYSATEELEISESGEMCVPIAALISVAEKSGKKGGAIEFSHERGVPVIIFSKSAKYKAPRLADPRDFPKEPSFDIKKALYVEAGDIYDVFASGSISMLPGELGGYEKAANFSRLKMSKVKMECASVNYHCMSLARVSAKFPGEIVVDVPNTSASSFLSFLSADREAKIGIMKTDTHYIFSAGSSVLALTALANSTFPNVEKITSSVSERSDFTVSADDFMAALNACRSVSQVVDISVGKKEISIHSNDAWSLGSHGTYGDKGKVSVKTSIESKGEGAQACINADDAVRGMKPFAGLTVNATPVTLTHNKGRAFLVEADKKTNAGDMGLVFVQMFANTEPPKEKK